VGSSTPSTARVPATERPTEPPQLEGTARARSDVIRRAGLHDVRSIAEFHTTCWNDAYRGIVPDEYLARVGVDERERRWRRRIRAGRRTAALAVADEDIAGIVSWG
jgi:hypothetical protein